MTTPVEAALAEVTRTLEQHLLASPDDARARFLARVVCDLSGGAAPRTLVQASLLAPATAPGCVGALTAMWSDFKKHGALTPHRALALANRLAVVVEHPAALWLLRAQADPGSAAARVLSDALAIRFPSFSARRVKVDRPLLEGLGVDLSTPGVTVQFNPDGGLALLATVKARLTLEPGVQTGRFVESGTRGGSGWANDERYVDGVVRATFFSPWHDGSEYTVAMDWLSWVGPVAVNVIASARKPAKTTKSRRVRRK